MLSELRKINKLPTLPAIAQEILSLSNDPVFSIEKLTDIVSRDLLQLQKYSALQTPHFLEHQIVLSILMQQL